MPVMVNNLKTSDELNVYVHFGRFEANPAALQRNVTHAVSSRKRSIAIPRHDS
jgi:hypothetical protein